MAIGSQPASYFSLQELRLRPIRPMPLKLPYHADRVTERRVVDSISGMEQTVRAVDSPQNAIRTFNRAQRFFYLGDCIPILFG